MVFAYLTPRSSVWAKIFIANKMQEINNKEILFIQGDITDQKFYPPFFDVFLLQIRWLEKQR